MADLRPKRVVLGVTGSIACYKACEIISSLRKSRLDVRVVMTAEAAQFVSPLTFQTLSDNPVGRDLFDNKSSIFNSAHISLAEYADLILIAPATANVLGKLTYGICDDLLTCTVMVATVPVLIAPAMNEKMFKHRIVQDNIKKLKNFGYKFIGPKKGRLACGDVGMGCLADVGEIVNTAFSLLA